MTEDKAKIEITALAIDIGDTLGDSFSEHGLIRELRNAYLHILNCSGIK